MYPPIHVHVVDVLPLPFSNIQIYSQNWWLAFHRVRDSSKIDQPNWECQLQVVCYAMATMRNCNIEHHTNTIVHLHKLDWLYRHQNTIYGQNRFIWDIFSPLFIHVYYTYLRFIFYHHHIVIIVIWWLFIVLLPFDQKRGYLITVKFFFRPSCFGMFRLFRPIFFSVD